MQTSIVLNINRDYEMAQIWVNQGPITRAHERQLLYLKGHNVTCRNFSQENMETDSQFCSLIPIFLKSCSLIDLDYPS